MQEDLFRYFCSATAGFVFSTRQEDIPESISGTSHEREVKALIKNARTMAVSKSMQLPESFSSSSRDDWIQLAMITMFECCEKYDRKRPFDNYVRFMVSKKMADHHRSLLRKNPPADKDILPLYYEMKKIKGDKAAVAELAQDTGKTVDELYAIINAGVGNRTVVGEMTDESSEHIRIKLSSEPKSPEEITAQKEIHRILLQCLKKLSQKVRALFLQHEIEEISFKKLFEQACYEKSFASFKRWYKTKIFTPVQECVLSKTY